MHGNCPAPLEALLSYMPLFDGVGDEALARIAQGTRDIRLATGDLLFRKGTPCNGIHFIVHGQVKLYFTSADDDERVLRILDQGRSFGEAQMLDEQPYLVTAEALSDCLVLHIGRDPILEEFDRSPRLRLRLLSQMSLHLHQVIRDSQSFSQQSGTQRFIQYLERQILASGGGERNVSVTLPTTKGNISSQINMTREHFSRTLLALSQEGLITVEDSRIFIPDLDKLRRHGRQTQNSACTGKSRSCSKRPGPVAGDCKC